MKLNRFYIKGGIDHNSDYIDITSNEQINQIRNVFRFRIGDKLLVFDGTGIDYEVSIDSFIDKKVTLKVMRKIENDNILKNKIHLFASIIKKDHFEWIVEKAVELGVSDIVPILSERSEKKNLNFERLQKIIIEATEQSGRGDIATLHDIVNLQDSLNNYRDIKSIAWHTQTTKFNHNDLEKILGMYIGPEGGWTQNEIDMFEKHNIIVRSLGPQTLRAETAVVATLSQIVL